MPAPALRVLASYDTHDNGGLAFRVTVAEGGRLAAVARLVWDGEAQKHEESAEEAWEVETTRVLVGRSPLIAMTEFSGGAGPEFDGNSMLLELPLPPGVDEADGDGREYMFVGIEAFRFRAPAPIVEFVSPVGNNDVPYPYAVDAGGRHYLMIEDVVIREVPDAVDEPYEHYYNARMLTRPPGAAGAAPAAFAGVEACRVGAVPVALTLCLDPEENFPRLQARGPPGADVEIRVEGTWRALDLAGYVALMAGFAEHLGVAKIPGRALIAARA